MVDWGAGERRRRWLETELDRIVAALPQLGVRHAIVFGSLVKKETSAAGDRRT